MRRLPKLTPTSSPNPRAFLLGIAALAAVVFTPATQGQRSCENGSASEFKGVIGRTAAHSTPAPFEPTKAAPGSPNVVYIVLDDTGFGDLGCYGSSVSTPNIDSLSEGGLLFNNFHSKAVCSPTRASLLTGRNAHAVGMKELAGGDQGYPHTRGRVPASAANIALPLLEARGGRQRTYNQILAEPPAP